MVRFSVLIKLREFITKYSRDLLNAKLVFPECIFKGTLNIIKKTIQKFLNKFSEVWKIHKILKIKFLNKIY